MGWLWLSCDLFCHGKWTNPVELPERAMGENSQFIVDCFAYFCLITIFRLLTERN